MRTHLRSKLHTDRPHRRGIARATLALVVALGAAGCDRPATAAASSTLLNVSYDPTRELWRDVNERFAADYKARTGETVTINQSHGGSSSQARAVIDGLEADVVTLASDIDTDAIAKTGLIAPDWADKLPEHSLPYYSTIVFVVRAGNPKGIHDWPDLIRPDVRVITPNPKTSGNGYLSFFSAWGSILLRGGSRADAENFVTRLYRQVPVLDSGARGATTTFVQKGIGDVQLAWENEAYLEVEESQGKVEIVYPPISIRAEPRVAVVDANVDRHGTRAIADAYLRFLYTEEGQELVAKHHYRPQDAAVLARHADAFPELRLFDIHEIAGSFADAHRDLIGEGGVFDRIYAGGPSQ